MGKFSHLIRILLLLISSAAFGTNFTTTNDGAWDSDGTWTGSGYPSSTSDNAKVDNNDSVYLDTSGGRITIGNLTFDNNGVLYIASGDTLEVDTIYVKNNGKIYVEGVLIVNGGVQMDNNSDLTVDLDGAITVDGDFAAGSGVDLKIDGDMTVSGDFDMGSGSTIAGSGSIDVAGTVDIPPGADPGGVLPVVLNYFKASAVEKSVMLVWETFSEISNDFFTIERSTNGFEFEVLTTVPGSGTTELIHKYEFLDRNPIHGISYYRLTQTDFDGTSETFRMVAVQYLGAPGSELKLYPNPLTDGPLHLQASNLEANQQVLLTISSLTGQRVFRNYYQVDSSGTLNAELSDLGQMPAGVYILRYDQKSRHQTARFIKK